MKKTLDLAVSAILLAASVLLPNSCEKSGKDGNSQLCISFAEETGLLTRTFSSLPDTNDFILRISDSSGNLLYDGDYGSCPEILDVPAGSYTVYVTSCDFTKPAFEQPQFGDEQCVVVNDGDRVYVELTCTQKNAGVRLDISPDFLDRCPDAVLFLKSSEGRLMYSYSEKRTAYFLPGPLSLMMSSGGTDEILMVRDLKEREMLSVHVSVAVSDDMMNGAGMSVMVDTARIWDSVDCVIGGPDGSGGNDVADAMSVADARKSSGMKDVWVNGYIVGGDLTSSSASFQLPFSSSTNILLGPKATTSDKGACISVQLPAGKVRESLNLVENPHLLGKRVCLRGDVVESYYGIPGLKEISEYKFL